MQTENETFFLLGATRWNSAESLAATVWYHVWLMPTAARVSPSGRCRTSANSTPSSTGESRASLPVTARTQRIPPERHEANAASASPAVRLPRIRRRFASPNRRRRALTRRHTQWRDIPSAAAICV